MSENRWLDTVIKVYKFNFGTTPTPVVWEVGSRDGHDGVELAKRIYKGDEKWFWSRATVVCFEPNPAQARIINENYPTVRVEELAASNITGTSDFIVYKGNEGDVGSSSLDLNWKGDDLEGDVIKVKTVKLRDMISKHDKIDIMKIDVEGYSMEVLEGLGSKLRNIKVFHIETETWTGSDKKVRDYMNSKGYILVDTVEQYGGMPDMVFVKG